MKSSGPENHKSPPVEIHRNSTGVPPNFGKARVASPNKHHQPRLPNSSDFSGWDGTSKIIYANELFIFPSFFSLKIVFCPRRLPRFIEHTAYKILPLSLSHSLSVYLSSVTAPLPVSGCLCIHYLSIPTSIYLSPAPACLCVVEFHSPPKHNITEKSGFQKLFHC